MLALSIVFLFSCKKSTLPVATALKETEVDLSTHKLMTYSITNKNSKYLVLFESGLGDGHESWNLSGVAGNLVALSDSIKSDILLYDRAGYGKSGFNASPRNINKLRSELEAVISQFANGRKIVLVGHSLGGMIVRDYAIKNPAKTAAILFVDASHEMYNHPSQAEEDLIYNTLKTAYGANSGAATEARELMEDSQYMTALPNLPNVPVIALTSMKIDANHNAADRQLWYNSKEALRAGVRDFKHVTTTASGHYIHQEEPILFLNNLKLLLSKLP